MATQASDTASLALWEAAADALANAASYSLPDGRTVTRQDAAEVRQMIGFYQRRVNAWSRTGAGARTGRHSIWVVPT